ncbi:MAG: foldase protein PrsA [Planctomycetota bacterium]
MVAVINGETVAWGAVRQMLVEASGGQVLSEWVLSFAVEKELRRLGLSIRDADVAREKSLLLAQLADDPDQAALLLERLRSERGLGDRRFELQLRRNAGLRKLIADEVEVTDEMIAAEYGRQHGPTTSVRMILVERLTDAQVVKNRLSQGESFMDLALEMSVDSSRLRGGLLPLISPWDDTFPRSIRTAAGALAEGQVSDPIALDGGFAILRCERKLRGSGVDLPSVVGAMEAAVRDRAEQVLMTRKSRVLLDQAEVSVLDADLNESWRRVREAAATPGG